MPGFDRNKPGFDRRKKFMEMYDVIIVNQPRVIAINSQNDAISARSYLNRIANALKNVGLNGKFGFLHTERINNAYDNAFGNYTDLQRLLCHADDIIENIKAHISAFPYIVE